MCVAHNIKRGLSLQQESCAWKQEIIEDRDLMAVYGLKKHYFFKLKVIKKWKFNHLALVSTNRAKASY